ncbi:MAG: chemotaxis protein CheA, partial [Spirochaetaceae bacterium]|nr:chemotaxis protein CheA [Spirochaetaceae bacterium]
MMEKMSDIFLDEANDLLDKLEDLLLELEQHPDDAETISAIFRIMHTIKGSSAMFGFDAISSFTHEVETAFDYVRNGKVSVNSDLITMTLQTRDHIRNLLDNADDPETQETSKALIQKFKAYVAANGVGELQSAAAPAAAEPKKEEAKKRSPKKDDDADAMETTYRIRFAPSPEVFLNGTRPHALLLELAHMGHITVSPYTSKLPTLSQIDPATCYMRWDIILTTKAARNAIEDVFIFLDSDSTIKIEPAAVYTDEDSIHPKRLGEILTEKHIVSDNDISDALSQQKQLGQLLTESKNVDPDEIQAALKEQKHIMEVSEKKGQETVSQTIKVSSEKLDQLIDLVGELVTFNARLVQMSQNIQHTVLSTLSEQGERLILELRDTTMDMRMLPIGTIFSRFRRLVRDLSSNLKKNIELVTEGAETELDKTVIEKLNDPLVHLIRNSVDHGVETPEVRRAMGKPETGKVTLKAQHAGAFVLITIEDDGAGLDKDKIIQKAVSKGLIPAGAELSEAEICDLIFMPGFSTADQISSVSGRGVGMDVVKRDITALNGTITTITKKGGGTKFILKLPLTLAIIEGMHVEIGGESFVIPLSAVLECIEFKREKHEDGEQKMCSY